MTVAPFAVAVILPVVFAIFGRYAPRNEAAEAAEAAEDNGRYLPYGVAGACMWFVGILVSVGGFFLLLGANRLWASSDSNSILTIYPTKVLWCFAPAFAAMLLPYFAVLYLLRRFGYAGQAAEIVAKGNAKVNLDGERVMRWLGWGLVAPIVLFTLPVIPTHLSVDPDAVSITRYGHIHPEVFRYAEAKHAWFVDGYALRDGTFQAQPDLLIDFTDGRRLRATAMSDGGDPPPQQLVSDLLTETSLQPNHVKTEADIPTGQ